MRYIVIAICCYHTTTYYYYTGDLHISFTKELTVNEDGMAVPSEFAFYKAILQEDSPSRHYPVAPSSSPTEELLYADDQYFSAISASSESDYHRPITQGYSGNPLNGGSNGSEATASKTVFDVTIPSVPPMSPDSTSSENTEDPPTPQKTNTTAAKAREHSENPSPLSPLQEGEASPSEAAVNHSLDVPSPRVKLNEMWEADKALPSSLLASGGISHSCMRNEAEAVSMEEMDATMMPEPLHPSAVYAGINYSPNSGRPDISLQPCQYQHLGRGAVYLDPSMVRALSGQILQAGRLTEADSAALHYALSHEPGRITM